jgi:hypothetical protein
LTLQGTNPRYFSAYYLIPIHTFCLFIACLFAVLNPLVIPFGTLYFFVAYGILRNQFIHVYQHQYDTKGKRPTIRFVRYTLDGHIVTQVRSFSPSFASRSLFTAIGAAVDCGFGLNAGRLPCSERHPPETALHRR